LDPSEFGICALPDLPTYLAYLAAVLAYQLSGPGPDMLLVMSRGVGQGRQAALWAAFGCVAAGMIQIPILGFGLALLVDTSKSAFGLLRLAGAAYLIYVGLKLLFSRADAEGAGPATSAPGGKSAGTAFRQGMICNLLNPGTLMFMLAILPQFVRLSSGPATPQLLILGATMKLTGLAILGTVALASSAVGGLFARHKHFVVWVQRFAGVAMIAFGFRLVLGGPSTVAK
jgi:threonine/homoserine/homoserine lactone efflux protein